MRRVSNGIAGLFWAGMAGGAEIFLGMCLLNGTWNEHPFMMSLMTLRIAACVVCAPFFYMIQRGPDRTPLYLMAAGSALMVGIAAFGSYPIYAACILTLTSLACTTGINIGLVRWLEKKPTEVTLVNA